ncbi:hypothetical protein ILUMI_12537 [Ignelater luminosus]|uniref:Sulfotransferase domain-containing protein n=1 Tax=Ignelater luminosus TaxID=2038154 RepID=A0A8K0CY98_IGNLU|nr:hypothetical protein ILUMI_12537 [Ignelater luminosus]
MENFDFEEIKPDDEVGKIIEEGMISAFCTKYIMVGQDRTVFASYYLQYAEKLKKFEVYDDDVWVASFPKAGTTWTQEMVWMIANNLDFQGAKQSLRERFPFLEISTILKRESVLHEASNLPIPQYHTNSVEYTKNLQRPRFIKSHLPFSLLPEQLQSGTRSPKMIYVVRNPKDTCISYYHHGTLLMGWTISLENFVKVFMADKSTYGSYWKHVLGYWNKRHLPNLLIIKYEDMKSNLPSVIKTVAQFLNKEITEEQIQLLCKHLSFESMKSNPAVNFEELAKKLRKSNMVAKDGTFIRTGIVGKYKEELSPETINKFNEWIKANIRETELENEYIFQI